MPLVINTNVAALNSQRQLIQSGNDMSQAMERLASGRRINTAADDAAGLAISNRMTSQIRGLNQAVRNANDGVSLIQTAEGAMDATTNILQRMRELAIQSANGIYADVDRQTLDAEVQQLKAELDRIATSTSFNGQLLLDGSLGEVDLQVGSQAYETITMNIPAMDINTLGGDAGGDIVGTTMSVDPTAMTIDGTGTNTLEINGQDVGDLSSATNMQELLDLFNTNVSGVTTTAFTEIVAASTGTGILRGGDTMDLTVHQLDGTINTYQIGDTGSMDELAARVGEITGGSVTGEINDAGLLVLSNSDGAAINVTYTGATAANTGITASAGIAINQAYQASLDFTSADGTGVTIAYGTTAVTNGAEVELGVNARTAVGDIQGIEVADGTESALAEGDVIINGITIDAVAIGADAFATVQNLADQINAKSAEHGVVATVAAGGTAADGVLSLNSVDGTEITIELTGAANATTTGLLETNNSATQGNSVADIQIATVDGAQESLAIIDTALETINDTRSQLGAISNRLEFTMGNLLNVVEKTEASRSRIMDADFAAETSELSRAQVLQQASQAMLAQANAQPQQVLQLLQG
ncbi:flagellin [Agaribacterium haliotis]|uniref:flagellin N-terminal helical domain-containing protein n=1 Tax=Agaribacterium haliotis TaxID=2013869 RepID=UPI000BB5732A|nr:flagellin [Agaribacterium haliotis]